MKLSLNPALAALLLAVVVTVTPAFADADHIFRTDPVVLITEGKAVDGRPEHALAWGPYTYWFASPENMAKFAANAEHYAIRLGGSCARMGPLSGEGHVEIFAVHDGGLYLFASEQCRTTFLANPALLLESDDPVPATTFETAKRGHELIEKAVASVGGKKALALTGNWSLSDARKTAAGTYSVTKMMGVDWFNGVIIRTEAWNDEKWGIAANADTAVMFSGDIRRPLAPDQRHAFDREMSRNLLSVLRSREHKDTVIVHAGTEQMFDRPVELVTVALNGSTNTLVLDARSNHVLAMRYRGRGPDGFLGDVEVRFKDFRRISKVLVPTSLDVFFNGKLDDSMSVRKASVKVDAPIDASVLEKTSTE